MIDDIDENGMFDGARLCVGDSLERASFVELAREGELLCAISRKGDLYLVEYLKKTTDPQWSIPFWSDVMENSLTDSLDHGRELAQDFFRCRRAGDDS